MFNALLATKDNDQHSVAVTQIDKGALTDSGALIKVDYSTINYKDALAVTATAPIIRRYPLVPGIDLAGVIEESDDPDWQVGDRVVVNGWGMGEGHSGGLAQYARVPASFLVKLPQNISTRHAMAIGTAGYTASLCVDALEAQGITPDPWRYPRHRCQRRRGKCRCCAAGRSRILSRCVHWETRRHRLP